MTQKMIAVLFAVAMLLGLAARAQSDNLIDKHLWNIATVRSIENNGAITACAPSAAASDSQSTIYAVTLNGNDGTSKYNAYSDL